ncbi:MAG: hypothetical protein KF832_03005 [Caldilineaceae bacterium]|nr:hypothetical protein [Caldilineaceae bacterium]
MTSYQVTFPNQQTLLLPATTATAILAAKAKYPTPLWQYRAERTLKLGGHQWIYPTDVAAAQRINALHDTGIIGTAWKLFNRGWAAAAEAYWLDTATYPDHPRHFGAGVIPLVDEDQAAQQIGWVRILQATTADEHFAIFVQFALLALFPPRPLPAAYQ